MAWRVTTQSMWQAGSHADCFCTNYKFKDSLNFPIC
uniref:Uncharacterized protein n=1 Tax=Vitis vinifera TaxID=29760 RepID=F6I6D7_VITVI